jgi:hypothetical protein
MRAVVPATVVAAALLAAPGSATPTCTFATDPRGDAGRPVVGDSAARGPNDDGVDLTELTLGSDRSQLAVAIRLAASTSPLDGADGDRRSFLVAFRARGARDAAYLEATVANGTWSYTFGAVRGYGTGQERHEPLGAATGRVDAARAEVRISVALTALARVAAVSPGTPLDDIRVTTSRHARNGAGPTGSESQLFLLAGDLLRPDRSYVAGSAPCAGSLRR